MRASFTTTLLSLSLAVLSASGAARADLPPPDGTKFVAFSFKVDNIGDFKDFVLLAYPCSASNGVPMKELTVVEPGRQISVGRRGGDCEMYAMGRAEFGAWRKGTPESTGAAVEDLITSSKVHACKGAPEYVYSLPTSDPRNAVVQTLHITQLDATSCALSIAGKGSKPSAATATATAASPATATVAPPSPATPSPATPTPTSSPTATSPALNPAMPNGASPTADPPPVNRGCAGCTTAPRADLSLGLLGAALAAAAIGTRRRR